jgi:hypothetical protein
VARFSDAAVRFSDAHRALLRYRGAPLRRHRALLRYRNAPLRRHNALLYHRTELL